MITDRDDKRIQVGDYVYIPCVVIETRERDNNIKVRGNLEIRSDLGGLSNPKIEISLNAKQVVRK
jgi:hypothetical protein